MKPNFSLKLSNDGIELLHRSSGGWASLGSVSFETDDVQAGCARLVAEASRLEPAGIRSKLVLPESQLRYVTILAPGPTDEARRYQIEAEIEALTPYSISELIYDWVIEDDQALVVICARDTLAEAEAFAEASGFNPIAFVASPEAGQFAGEPSFGLTSVAGNHLAPGDRVQFDSEPVRAMSPAPTAAASAPAIKPKPIAAASPAPAGNKAGPSDTATAIPRKQIETEAPSDGVSQPPVDAKPVAPRAAEAGARQIPGARPRIDMKPRPIEPSAPSFPLNTDAQPPASEPFAKVGSLVRRMGTRLRREQAAETPPNNAVGGTSDLASSSAQSSKMPAAAKPASAAVEPPPAVAAKLAAITSAAKKPAKRPAPQPVARPAPGLGDALAAAPAPRPAPSAKGVTPAETPAARPSRKPAVAGVSSESDMASVAFASRRGAAPVLAATGSGNAGTNPGGRLAVLPEGREKSGPSIPTRIKRRLKRARRSLAARFGSGAAGQAADRPAAAAGPAKRRDAVLPEPIVPTSRPPASDRDKATEAEALTIFGARGRRQPAPSLARRGLMAVGGVSMLAVAAGVWFLYFNGETPLAPGGQIDPGTSALQQINEPGSVASLADAGAGTQAIQAPDAVNTLPDNSGVSGLRALIEGDPEGGASSTVTDLRAELDSAAERAAIAAEQAAEANAEAMTAGVEQLAGTGSDAASAGGSVLDDAGATTDPDRLLEALVQEALNETLPAETLDRAAQATEDTSQPVTQSTSSDQAPRVAATQISDTPQVALVAGSTAQPMSLPRGIGLPSVAEVSFAAPAPPPPFGTEFTFDDNGLVEATPEGATTPSGVTVFARRPDVTPAVRPEGIAPPEALAPAQDAAPAIEAAIAEANQIAVPDDTPRADPALADARPRPRSPRVQAIGEQLAPEAPDPAPEPATEVEQQDAAAQPIAETETAALETPPPGGVSLAGLRPQTRPTDLVPPAVVAELAAVQAADAALDTDGATPEAVSVSLRPSARPDDVSERGQAALAAAGPRSDVEDNAGETASAAAAPSIPSSASVARQATETDAINLREVNLIGVFGTASERRALVRLSSGRVVRVEVGDRLDGGRVTAIGETELRYSKRGRNEVLEIGG